MLFKYIPSVRVDILENLKIRFSPLMSLNDPFEYQPLIDIKDNINSIKIKALNDLDNLWDESDITEKTEENRKLLEKTRHELIVDITSRTNPHAVGQELMNLLSDHIGILSLSRTEDNLLMWSHYADEGRGFVIGFNDEHDFFKQRRMNGKLTRPIPVIYTNKRSKIIPSGDRYYEKLLCEKPRDWAYEEEERLFRVFLTKETSIGKDAYGMDIVLTDLPKEAISSIYLGYKISDHTKNRILLAIEKKIHSMQCLSRQYFVK